MVKPWLKPQPPTPAPAPAPASPVHPPAPTASPSGDGYGAMVDALKHELDGLRKTTDTLDALYRAQTGRLKELEADLDKTRVEVISLYDEVRKLTTRVAALETPTADDLDEWDETHPPEPYPGTVPRTAKSTKKSSPPPKKAK